MTKLAESFVHQAWDENSKKGGHLYSYKLLQELQEEWHAEITEITYLDNHKRFEFMCRFHDGSELEVRRTIAAGRFGDYTSFRIIRT